MPAKFTIRRSFSFRSTMDLFLFLLGFSSLVRLSSTQLTQYQQMQMRALNGMNGITSQSAAFMMTRGHPNTNPQYSQYITFETMQFAANAVTFREYGAFQAQTPGLYLLSYTIRGNQSTPTQVQLRGPRGAIYATTIASEDNQGTSTSLVPLRRNDTVYLQITNDGGILENAGTNGTFNSFMGILLIAENANPFLQNVFANNNLNPNNFQDVGGFGSSFPNSNIMGNSFGIPFAT